MVVFKVIGMQFQNLWIINNTDYGLIIKLPLTANKARTDEMRSN